MWLEFSKGLLKNQCEGDYKTGIMEGFYTAWNDKRIKNAFNGGNGTIKDFKRYMNDNKNTCVFIQVKEVF